MAEHTDNTPKANPEKKEAILSRKQQRYWESANAQYIISALRKLLKRYALERNCVSPEDPLMNGLTGAGNIKERSLHIWHQFKKEEKNMLSSIPTDQEGQKRQKWETFSTKAEARKRKSAVEAELDNGTFIPPNTTTVEDF